MILSLLLTIILVSASDIHVTTYASAGSDWLESWSYRKSHAINSASGAGTNYQVRIIAHYGSGGDFGEDVYFNEKCREDFGDVRFTDDDGNTLLDYWMEKKVNGDYAIFWVEIEDDLSSNDQTIYLYYGKNDATTTSNGADTFIRWDDFDLDYSENDVPKAARGWSTADTPLVKTVSADRSGLGCELEGPPTSRDAIYMNIPSPQTGVKIHHYFHIDNIDSYIDGWFSMRDSSTALLTAIKLSNGEMKYCSEGIYRSFNPQLDYAKDTWYKITEKIIAGVGGSFVVEVDGIDYTGKLDGTAIIINANSYWYVDAYSSNTQFCDHFFIAKYVYPEPGHGSWGGEEHRPETKMLTVKLSGEHDYLFKEDVKIKIVALVKDAETTEPTSDANVTIEIYDPEANLWISDNMTERLLRTGVYMWESTETIMNLMKDRQIHKGVYIVHVQASYQEGPIAADVLEFHIDPPFEEPVQLHTILSLILLGALMTIISFWYVDHRRLTRKHIR